MMKVTFVSLILIFTIISSGFSEDRANVILVIDYKQNEKPDLEIELEKVHDYSKSELWPILKWEYLGGHKGGDLYKVKRDFGKINGAYTSETKTVVYYRQELLLWQDGSFKIFLTSKEGVPE